MASLPWYSNGYGGMVTQASSASRATTASVSPRSTASTKWPTTPRSCGGVRDRRTRGVDRSLGERCACALERPPDRRLGRLQDRRAFAAREAEYIAQHKSGALERRQPLQPGDERERGRLLRLVARRRTGCGVGQAFEEDVRVGLEPERLGAARRRRRLGHRRNLLGGSSRFAAEQIEAAVAGDSVEPRAEGRAPLELVEAAPGREQGLLEHVFGVLQRAEDPVAMELELAPEGVGQLPERQLIAVTGAAQQPLGHQLRRHQKY
jgi:hypothetical protein